MSTTEIVAENLSCIKSVGSDVKTFDDYWEEGKQKELLKGIEIAREILLDILDTRFDILDADIIRQVKKVHDLHLLKILSRRALKAKTISEFTEFLQAFVED